MNIKRKEKIKPDQKWISISRGDQKERQKAKEKYEKWIQN